MAKEKKKGSKGKVALIVLLVLIVIGIISCSGSSGSSEPEKITSSNSAAASSESTKTETFTVGDTADFNGIQVTLSSAVLSNGSEYITPDDGKYYIGLIFDIVNGSSSDITISSVASFDAYVDDYSVTQDIMGYQAPEWDGFNQLDGSVAAEKRMNGVIVYQVPKDFQNFEITVTPDFWGNKKVTFNVPAESTDHSAVE